MPADWRRSVPSSDGSHHYTVQWLRGIYSCSCPAWRNQRAPLHLRTCKHLRALLGDTHERRRAPDSFRGCTRVPTPASCTPRPDSSAAASWTPEARPMKFRPWSSPASTDLGPGPWYYSLKLDGVFARWQDGHFYSSSGRRLPDPPAALAARLPRSWTLDGELYAGPHRRSEAVRIVHGESPWPASVRFVVFDLVLPGVPWGERRTQLLALARKHRFPLAHPRPLRSASALARLQRWVEDHDHEGLVIRHATSPYSGVGRHDWKWKPWRLTPVRVLSCDGPRRCRVRELRSPRAFFTVAVPRPVPVGTVGRVTFAGRDPDTQRPEVAVWLGGDPKTRTHKPVSGTTSTGSGGNAASA